MGSYLAILHVPERYLRIADEHPDLGLPDLTRGRWVFLHGPAGCGKTHRAVQILHAHFARVGRPKLQTWRPWHNGPKPGAGPAFVDWPALLAAKKRTFGREDAEDPLDAVLDNRSVVLLDDVAAERPTDFAIDALSLVISNRYNLCAPTVITSNRNLDGLAASYGNRIASRIREVSIVGDQSGKDWRVAGARC